MSQHEIHDIKHGDVYLACKPVSTQWKELGIRLGLDRPTLDIIEDDNRGVEKCLYQVIAKWLDWEIQDEFDRPSWKTLCVALSCINKLLAESISKEHDCGYVNPVVSKVVTQSRVSPVFLPLNCGCGQCTIQGWMSGRYCQNEVYVDSTHPKLVRVLFEKSNPRFRHTFGDHRAAAETRNLRDFFQYHCTVETWRALRKLVTKQKCEVADIVFELSLWLDKPLPMITDLLELKRHFHNSLHVAWFNYRPLEYLAKTFLSHDSDVMTPWIEYCSRFKDYCSNRDVMSMVGVFYDLPDKGQNVFYLEMDKYYYGFTLTDVENLSDSLSRALGIPPVSLHLVTVGTSSLIIYFYYCFSDYLLIFKSLTTQQLWMISQVQIKGYKISSLIDFHNKFSYDIQKYNDYEVSQVEAFNESQWQQQADQASPIVKGSESTFDKEDSPTDLAVQGITAIVEQIVTSKASFTLKDLGEALRRKYEEYEDIPTNEWFWPPLCQLQYITLAMVSNHHYLRDDYFTHKSLHKQPADDLPYEKKEAMFNEIFPDYEESSFSTLISGRPGIGKTVLLTKVCKDWGKGNCLKNIQVIIHVSLRKLHCKSPQPSLLDMIELHFTDSDRRKQFCRLIEAKGGKNVCFAFDGLDEYPLLNTSNDIVSEIIGKQKLPMASVIVTSRPTASHIVKQKMKKHAEIIGFMPHQIESYINEYYTSSANSLKGKKLIAYLQDHPNVKDMCFLPLHLAMIVHLNDKSSLPETKSDIYHRFVSHLIFQCVLKKRKVDDSKILVETFAQMSDYFSEEENKHFETTCLIAFHTRVQSCISFNTQDIQNRDKFNLSQNQLEQFNKNIFGIVSSYSVCTDHGLTHYYRFQHLTFQEFLAAYYISQLKENEQFQLLDEYGKQPEMKEVWKFFFGIIKSSPNLIPLFDRISKQHTNHGSNTLFLSNCVFETQNQELCKRLLLSRDKKLNINNVILSAPDCSAIGFILRHTCDFITDLMMNYCQVGEYEFHALKRQIDCCSEFKNLKNFQIRSQLNPLKQEGATDLHMVLSKMSKLTELRLYGNQLESAKKLSKAIKPMKNLQILVLTKNNLGPTYGSYLSDLLENNPNLIQFYASYNPLTTEGLQKLSPGLLKCKKLRRLGLRGCQLDENAGTILSEILSALSSLEQLELYLNLLRDKGISDLTQSLQKAPKLQQVSFTNNEIGDEGGCQLAQAVAESESIRRIRLYYNDFSVKTRLAFFDVAKKKSTTVECAL